MCVYKSNVVIPHFPDPNFQIRAKRAFGRYIHSKSCCNDPISSEMAGPRVLKLGGLVEGMGENVLAKEFFGSVNIQGQVGGPQVPLLGHGNDIETSNLA